jgi:hypothetical protein
MPRPNHNFSVNPWGFTTQALPHNACFTGASTSCSWSCPQALYTMPIPPVLWKSIFCPSTKTGWTSNGPHRPLLLRAASLGALPSVELPPLAFVLDNSGPLPPEVRSFIPQEDFNCPSVVLPPTRLGHFWGLSPLCGTPKVMPQCLLQSSII